MASATDEDRTLLLSRSQELEWVDDLTGFQCVRCNRVLIRHYIANCGHKFCLNCKKILDDGSKRWRCPAQKCNKIVEKIDLQDFYFEETLFELRTHCPNHKYGCHFIGQLKDIGRHLKKCEDTRENALPVLIDEKNNVNSSLIFNNKLETMSLALTEIQKSISEMKKEKREEKLSQERKWVEMGNKWTDMEKRMNSVVANMLLMPTKNSSNIISSETKMIKENAEEIAKLKSKSENWLEMLDGKDKKYNEKTNKLEMEIRKMTSQLAAFKQESHLSPAQDQLVKQHSIDLKQTKQENHVLKNAIDNIKKELTDVSRREEILNKSISLTKPQIYTRFFDEYYKRKPDFAWTVSDIKNKMYRMNSILVSEVFSFNGYPFGAQARLTLKNDNYIHVSLAYKNVVKSSGTVLNLKPIPDVYYTLKYQSANYVRHANSPFNSVVRYDVFHNERELLALDEVLNNSISIDIHVEPPLVAEQGYSYDGILTWAINDFRSKRELEKKVMVTFQKSPYFYSSPKGYRMVSYVRLNGYEYNGLTASIDFLTGPYDKELSTSFKHKSTVTLFHPKDPSKHLVKSMERDLKDGSWYMINVATHREVEQLLDNDTLHYQIKIEPV